MQIYWSPQSHPGQVVYQVDGEVVRIDGVALDLSSLADGDMLPAEAAESPWFRGARRVNGVLHVSLLLPCAPGAPLERAFPEPTIDPPDGVILLPGDAAPAPAPAAAGDASVDWQMVEPINPPPEPVLTVTSVQAKLVLDDDGLYSLVEALCLDHPVAAVRIYWEAAREWDRGHAVIAALAVELDLGDEDLDDMFARAALK